LLTDAPGIPSEVLQSSRETLPAEYCVRYDILRILSCTCRRLRSICLPMLWQHVEACVVVSIRARWYNEVTKALRSRCKVLARSPQICSLVQTFTVSLTHPAEKGVISAFAECLAFLPNLHTLNVIHASSASITSNALKKVFKNKQYPQIRTMMLPDAAHFIVQCCSGVREIRCGKGSGARILAAIKDHCPHVDTLRNIQGDEETLKALVEAAPNLRELQISRYSHRLWGPVPLRALSGLSHLCIIDVEFISDRLISGDVPDFLQDDDAQSYIRAAENSFQDARCPRPSAKLTYTRLAVRDPGANVHGWKTRVEWYREVEPNQ